MTWETTDGSPSGASARAYPDYASAVQDVAALRAVPATERADKQVRLVEAKAAEYRFDETGTGADDGDLIIKPTDVSNGGRWYKMPQAGQSAPQAHATTHQKGGVDRVIQEKLCLPIRNESGVLIAAGKLVAAVGYSIAEDRVLIDIADKDDPTKRPALGVTRESVADEANSDLLISVGTIENIDTATPGWSVNDQLVLGSNGAFSRPPPDVDPFTGGIQLVGSVTRVHATLGSIFVTCASGLLPITAAQFFATRETTPSGSVSGGEVTRSTGLNVAVAAGQGFINNGTDMWRVTWDAVANLLLAASDTNYVYVDKFGVVKDSVSQPSAQENIVLADVVTDGSSILMLANHRTLITETPARFHDYARDVIGNIVVSGLVTTKDAVAYRLEVDAGSYYNHDFEAVCPATDPITFTYWYRDGSGGWTRVVSQTLIDKDNWDDGTGSLNDLVGGEWKKDLLFVVYTASGVVEYHVFYGQEVFGSQALAEAGALPAAASDVIANGVRSAGIVIEGAGAAITSVVDVRPFLGQLSPGTTAVTDHGLLGGLGDDDHAQYLLVGGSRAMTGSLDMGANAITNVGNVDGVDVSDHSARHQNGGADAISVAGLAGLLADSQTPLAHKDTHKSGGADALATTDLLEAIVKRLQTTTGPTTLLMGALADGEFLKRVGAALVGAPPLPVDWTTASTPGPSSTSLVLFQDFVTLATGAKTGTYRFLGTLAIDNGKTLGEVRLWNDTDSAQIGALHVYKATDAAARNVVVIVGEVVLAGVTKDIKLQWRAQAGGNTQTVRTGRVEMQRVG